MTLHLEKKYLFFIIGLTILVGAGIYFGFLLSKWKLWDAREPQYTVVYLTSGDMYFGEFSRFPSPHLTNVWFLERETSSENQPQLGISSFKSAIWGPKDVLYLNPENILWQTELREDSPLIQAIQQKNQSNK